MTLLRFHGVVEDDVWKLHHSDHALDINGGPTIGGADLVRLVDENFRLSERVMATVTIGTYWDSVEGEIMVWTGSRGYDEVTLAEPSVLMVGETDLRQVVGKLDGQFITLWLANRPVDFESYSSAPDVASHVPGVEILELPDEPEKPPIVVLGQLVEPDTMVFFFPLSGQPPKIVQKGQSITIKNGPAVMEARRPGSPPEVDGPAPS